MENSLDLVFLYKYTRLSSIPHTYLYYKISHMSTKKKAETSVIHISPQILNDYDHLKHILSQITGRDDLTDDEVVAALIDGFMHSYIHGQQAHSHEHHHHHHTQEGCCGWGQCGSHSDEKKAKGECCGGKCC